MGDKGAKSKQEEVEGCENTQRALSELGQAAYCYLSTRYMLENNGHI